MLTRRDFLKSGMMAGAGLAFFWRGGTLYARSKESRVAMPVAQTPGGTLDAREYPQICDAAADPACDAEGGHDQQKGGKNVDYYEISVKAVLSTNPAGGPAADRQCGATAPSNPPARKGCCCTMRRRSRLRPTGTRPVRVKWVNELVDANGNYLPHLLPVDPTLHWANPPGGTAGRDMRPTFTSTPGRYTGPVPMVTHVHGIGRRRRMRAMATPRRGTCRPRADIPTGYANVGTWYDFFKGKAAANYWRRRWGTWLRYLPVPEQ